MTVYGPEYMRAMLVCRRRPVSAEEPGKTMNVLLVPVTLLEVEFPLLRNRENLADQSWFC